MVPLVVFVCSDFQLVVEPSSVFYDSFEKRTFFCVEPLMNWGIPMRTYYELYRTVLG